MCVNEQRYVNLFNAIDYFAFGSLWRVRNSLWRKAINGFVSKDDTDYHPGLSLGKKNLTSIKETVPMLLGSHSHKTGFPIRNFSPKKSKKMSFFMIKPFFLSVSDAVGDQCGIVPNEHKPRLEKDEKNELITHLLKRGIRFDD